MALDCWGLLQSQDNLYEKGLEVRGCSARVLSISGELEYENTSCASDAWTRSPSTLARSHPDFRTTQPHPCTSQTKPPIKGFPPSGHWGSRLGSVPGRQPAALSCATILGYLYGGASNSSSMTFPGRVHDTGKQSCSFFSHQLDLSLSTYEISLLTPEATRYREKPPPPATEALILSPLGPSLKPMTSLAMFSPSAQALSPRGFLSPSQAHPLPLSFFSRSIIGTIPLMPNPGPSSQTASGTQGLQVQPITPQLLTNAQGQIIATVIGNQILPVINTQGITLSPIKPGQQLHQPSQTSVGQAASQSSLLHLAHSQASMSQSPVRQASSSSSSSSSSSALSVGQLVSNPQTAAGEVDGVNLEEIREFAKAFKIRRLSLGLTQTQVGQALSATEGPAYSQSAICRHTILRSHFFLPQEAQENTIASSLTAKLNPGLLYPARFEKLDITPKSAQKIKPVLERWMAEAEARHRAGMQNLTEFIGSEPSKKRKRRTSFTPQALEILNAHFEKNTHPSGQEMTEIAEKLNYDREVVRVWFCNKRQALKNTIKRLKQHEPATAVPLEPLTDSLEENS
ncbi:hypothetical protein FD755_012842 [Muntiacus reevesi]|uniref:POU domain protein n=1 Tax=Muntiacus reevesi TaxID=9886 RepID=A0A5N3XQV7_MUNRE|nr:hypothetical protein FD755_012842 [Muntiacus reevesi]